MVALAQLSIAQAVGGAEPSQTAWPYLLPLKQLHSSSHSQQAWISQTPSLQWHPHLRSMQRAYCLLDILHGAAPRRQPFCNLQL
jgi:hypothetical protein